MFGAQIKGVRVIKAAPRFYPHGFALYEFTPASSLYLGRLQVDVSGAGDSQATWDAHDVWCMTSPSGWGIGEIARTGYDPAKGSFEYKNTYWVSLGVLWTIVREGKRLEPWKEDAVKKLAEVDASLVPQDVLALFAAHTGGKPDSVVLFPEAPARNEPAVIRDLSGRGHDLTVKPGTPQPVSETDEIFGSPTRCCECDAPNARRVQRDACMYPAHFCERCRLAALPGELSIYLGQATGPADGLRRVAASIRKLRAAAQQPKVAGPSIALTSGVQPRYPRPAKLPPVFKFYGWVGNLDVYENVDEFFTPRRPKCEAPPRGAVASVRPNMPTDETPLYTQLRGIRDLVGVADLKLATGVAGLALLAADMVLRLGGREKLQAEIDREVEHEKRHGEPCAGCGKPSVVWLDDDETVRCCDECDVLIPPMEENGAIISADAAVGWVKRLRDPYARHTLWEQHVQVCSGYLARMSDDPRGFDYGQQVRAGQQAAYWRSLVWSAAERDQKQKAERRLRTDEEARQGRLNLRLLGMGDLLGRRWPR